VADACDCLCKTWEARPMEKEQGSRGCSWFLLCAWELVLFPSCSFPLPTSTFVDGVDGGGCRPVWRHWHHLSTNLALSHRANTPHPLLPRASAKLMCGLLPRCPGALISLCFLSGEQRRTGWGGGAGACVPVQAWKQAQDVHCLLTITCPLVL
jgi:hypothetical protein